MSNYPAGAENDKNAPYNREERLQVETIGLFEYLENLQMPYEIRCKLKEFENCRQIAMLLLKDMISQTNNKSLLDIAKLLVEPEIFIENE